MSLQKVAALVCHSFVYGVRGQTPAPPSDFSGPQIVVCPLLPMRIYLQCLLSSQNEYAL